MALKKCPICGEKYSDTYKNCPFCEEEEALNGGGQMHRRSGRRTARGKEPNILSPILVIILLILILLLFYMFFGQKLLHTMGLDEIGSAVSSSETTGAASSSQSSGSTSAEAPVIGENGGSSSGSSSDLTAVDITNLPETLTLSSQDFTMKVGDAPVALKVSGGNGTYTWTSDNESVATVDENGKVTAVSAGSANVTATDGNGKGTCIVRVKGTGTPNTGSSSGTLVLSSTDFTLPVGDSYTLSVSGAVSSAVSWSSENSAVATVSASGSVTGVSAGKTNIVATVNGTTLKCIVRVK